MYDLKLFFKSKEFIISSLIIVLLTCINIYFFLNISYDINGDLIEGVNSYSFWKYVRNYNLGSVIMFLSPTVVLVTSITMFFNKVKGSYFHAQLLRFSYKKLIKKEILFSYIRGAIILVSVSILTFILGTFLFPYVVTKTEFSDYITSFFDDGFRNPFLYFVMYQFLIGLYCVMITNLGIIVIRFVRKLNLTIIITFVLMNALNFLVGNIAVLIAKIIGSKEAIIYAKNINIFEGYFVQTTLTNAFIHTGIYIIITSIIIYNLYKNKERVVLDFD